MTLEPRCGHYLWDTQDAAASWDAKIGAEARRRDCVLATTELAWF